MSFFIFLLPIFLYAESVSTNLTDPVMIETYRDVTTNIRCICLPSLPIKSCSFNNCVVSAELKLFIENRIRMGESSEVIIQKMINGFGESAIDDPIVQKFKVQGSLNMVNGVVYGFGEKILAEPSPIGINLTIFLVGIFGLLLIFYYFKKNSARPNRVSPENRNQSKKYLQELD